MTTSKSWLLALSVWGLAVLLVSCSAIQQATSILNTATKTAGEAKTVIQAGQMLRSTFADITEEEEYYIGRSVAALILSKYSVYQNDGLTQYINIVGNAVAIHSDRP